MAKAFLRKTRESRVRSGHPWVFASDIEKVEGEFENGDVVDVQSYKKVMEQTGCYGVSIGRGAIGKPYLFAQLKGLEYDFDLYGDLKEHVSVLQKIYPEKMVANEIKKHVVNYTKGKRGTKQLITKIMQMKDSAEILSAQPP